MNTSAKNIKDSKESYFTASQSQLIWARFKKQRAAMIAASILGFIVFIGNYGGAPCNHYFWNGIFYSANYRLGSYRQ